MLQLSALHYVGANASVVLFERELCNEVEFCRCSQAAAEMRLQNSSRGAVIPRHTDR